MHALPAQELKRRGIGAVDEELKKHGVVHIVKNNRPKYVILSTQDYEDLLEQTEQTYKERLKASLEDVKNKRIRKYRSANHLIKEFGLE